MPRLVRINLWHVSIVLSGTRLCPIHNCPTVFLFDQFQSFRASQMWQNGSVSGRCWCRGKFGVATAVRTGPGMAAWTSSMRTTRCWFPVSADVVTLSLPQNGCRRIPQASLVCPSDMKLKIIERSSVHEVGDIPGVRFKVVKAECHYFQELMCVMVCFSMGFPQISLGPLGRMKWWSRMKMDAQCTAPGGRLWPGCLVQEQEGHSFCDCCQDTILDPMLSWTCFQEKPRS